MLAILKVPACRPKQVASTPFGAKCAARTCISEQIRAHLAENSHSQSHVNVANSEWHQYLDSLCEPLACLGIHLQACTMPQSFMSFPLARKLQKPFLQSSVLSCRLSNPMTTSSHRLSGTPKLLRRSNGTMASCVTTWRKASHALEQFQRFNCNSHN